MLTRIPPMVTPDNAQAHQMKSSKPSAPVQYGLSQWLFFDIPTALIQVFDEASDLETPAAEGLAPPDAFECWRW